MSSPLTSAVRVFDISFADMLWSRRAAFMALAAAGPLVLALVARTLQASGAASLRVDGVEVAGHALFDMMVSVLLLGFVVPALGVFYGTSLVAGGVEDRTITYLFTRPIRRGAVLLGKYLAYLACTTLVLLPSAMGVYFLIVPFAEVPATFGTLVKDLGILALGLGVYGALFALVGALVRRPLVTGLVFAFGWEPVALLMPGYLNRFTIAYYLQRVVRDEMAPAAGVSWLVAITIAWLWLAMRAVEHREYVLEQ